MSKYVKFERSNLAYLSDFPVATTTPMPALAPTEERGEEESETLPLLTTTPNKTVKAGRD